MLVHFFFMEDKYIWPRKFSGKKECFLLKASHRHNPTLRLSHVRSWTCHLQTRWTMLFAKC